MVHRQACTVQAAPDFRRPSEGPGETLYGLCPWTVCEWPHLIESASVRPYGPVNLAHCGWSKAGLGVPYSTHVLGINHKNGVSDSGRRRERLDHTRISTPVLAESLGPWNGTTWRRAGEGFQIDPRAPLYCRASSGTITSGISREAVNPPLSGPATCTLLIPRWSSCSLTRLQGAIQVCDSNGVARRCVNASAEAYRWR